MTPPPDYRPPFLRGMSKDVASKLLGELATRIRVTATRYGLSEVQARAAMAHVALDGAIPARVLIGDDDVIRIVHDGAEPATWRWQPHTVRCRRCGRNAPPSRRADKICQLCDDELKTLRAGS